MKISESFENPVNLLKMLRYYQTKKSNKDPKARQVVTPPSRGKLFYLIQGTPPPPKKNKKDNKEKISNNNGTAYLL